jgi:hypothetical protein
MNLNPTAQEIRSAFQALEELKAAPYKAKSARLKILRAHHDNRALIQLFRVATDFKLPLHIHLNPTVDCQNIEGDLEKNFETFLHITEQCASGEATGMKARHSNGPSNASKGRRLWVNFSAFDLAERPTSKSCF